MDGACQKVQEQLVRTISDKHADSYEEKLNVLGVMTPKEWRRQRSLFYTGKNHGKNLAVQNEPMH